MTNNITDIWGADYANGVIPFFHKDANGNVISKQVSGGTYNVKNSIIILEEYPDLQYGFTIKLLSGNQEKTLTRVETNYSNLGEYEYRVDIVTGFVHFHPSLEGCKVKVEDYYGKGLWVITDKRIIAEITKLPNGSFDYKSLEEMIANAKGFISKGTWSGAIEYNRNNIVVYDGVIYRASKENLNKNPKSNANYWGVVIDVKSIIDNNIAEHANITASSTKLGHVKLSDSISSKSDTTNGVAATPYAVKLAYDLAERKCFLYNYTIKKIENSIPDDAFDNFTASGFYRLEILDENNNLSEIVNLIVGYGSEYDSRSVDDFPPSYSCVLQGTDVYFKIHKNHFL